MRSSRTGQQVRPGKTSAAPTTSPLTPHGPGGVTSASHGHLNGPPHDRRVPNQTLTYVASRSRVRTEPARPGPGGAPASRPAGVDLPVWLRRQRTAHQRGTLPPDRAAALNELGIDWTPGRGVADVRIDQAWQARFDDARQYQAAHGHLRPPVGTNVNGKRLDAWLSVQRARNREGSLTPQQIAALDELGIHW